MGEMMNPPGVSAANWAQAAADHARDEVKNLELRVEYLEKSVQQLRDVLFVKGILK